MREISLKILFLLFLGLAGQPLFAQEHPLKDLVEERRKRKFALYPSTLRMINLTQNKDYYELVDGIEKILIYQLDSAMQADKSYSRIADVYRELNFEEYVTVYGGDQTLVLLGKEDRVNQFVGYGGTSNQVVAFYIRGNFAWEKIPTLLNSFEGDDMLNFFDFK